MQAKCTIPRQKNPKIFWGGAQPPPPLGRGTPLTKPAALCACGASMLAPSALDLPPQTKILDPPVLYETKLTIEAVAQ